MLVSTDLAMTVELGKSEESTPKRGGEPAIVDCQDH